MSCNLSAYIIIGLGFCRLRNVVEKQRFKQIYKKFARKTDEIDKDIEMNQEDSYNKRAIESRTMYKYQEESYYLQLNNPHKHFLRN